jgi:hypothetical protein
MFYDSTGQVSIQQYTTGVRPLVSLSAVSSTGAGTALDGVVVRQNATMVVTSSAGVSAGSVQMQGSVDGTNWFNLGSAVSTTTASTVFTPVATTTPPTRFVRANVATAITGGTISATVALSG